MTAYYNEIDPFAAAWLRELIKANLIARGEVDERSIEEVKPDDLKGFTQCHFFAGIGVWSYALRLAGWPDSRPVWTGSCPCPSFSAAGQGKGFEDPRHLWACWFGLIRESRPPTIFGEQVDKAIGFGWLDLVQTDLEAQGYAVGATVFGAHSVGAPHIRQRLYFVADASGERIRTEGRGSNDDPTRAVEGEGNERQRIRTNVGDGGTGDGRLYGDDAPCGCWDRDAWHRKYGMLPGERCENAGRIGVRRNSTLDGDGTLNGQSGSGDGPQGPTGRPGVSFDGSDSEHRRQAIEKSGPESRGGNGIGINANGPRLFTRQQATEGMGYRSAVEPTGGVVHSLNTEQQRLEGFGGHVREWRGPGWLDPLTARSVAAAGAARGYWSDCDWWYGRDGKYRPIGAGLFPLVTGATGRMGKLRGYGNALTAPVAAAFIEAFIETKGLK